MTFARVIFSLALPVAIAGMPAAAQEVIIEKALSLDLAQGIAEAALAKCRADGNHVSVTVIDRDGLTKAVLRDDGTGPAHAHHQPPQGLHVSYLQAAFGRLGQTRSERSAIAGLKDTAGTIALGGGVPIKIGNEVIGAIGVSGSPGAGKDEACANAGIEKFADKLK